MVEPLTADHSNAVRDPVRESEERYRAFVENSSEGIWRLEFDPPIDTSLPIDVQVSLAYRNGRLAECNQVMARMYGLQRPEDLVGVQLDFMLPESDPRARAYLASIVAAGYRATEVESEERDARGNVKHFSNSMTGVVADGHLVRVWGTQRDISDRKSAEHALRESQKEATAALAYLAAVVESADDAIIAKDLDGIIQSCNAGAERIFGYTASELIGRPVRILIPADRQSDEDHILDRIRRGERVDHFETVRLRKDRTLIDVALTVSPVRDGAGTIIGISKVARDITAQKRAAAELAAQQAWFRITLASIGDAVLASDPNGRVTFMNATAERLTGWPQHEAAGRPLHDVFRIVNESTRQPLDNPALLVLRLGHVVGLANHTVLIARDGMERPIADSAAPIRDPGGHLLGVVLVFRDVSQERRLEVEHQGAAAERERLLEAERAARAEAERASRVKDDFVAMVSHELRTPLNAILGWTQLMMRARHDPTTIERGLDIVARNTRVQAQLISDLLDISRIVSGKLQLEMNAVDLRAIVADAIETVQHEAEAKRIVIDQDIEGPLVAVAGDPARLQQVVWNLLSNAVKFTPADGRVRIGLRSVNGHAEITVIDNGAGIRPDVLPHVFDRFHQADRSMTRRFGGLGLGLSIVKHLVEQHGGTVHASSEGEGQGAAFTITLPASTEAVANAAPAASRIDVSQNVSLDSMRLLVVEDESATLEFLKQLLEGHGALVTGVASAQDALDAFRSNPPDILISDIGLPDIDGYDLMQRIRQSDLPHGRMVPAIALTAYARAEDRTQAFLAGYQAHIVKPAEPAELIATIASFARLITWPRR